MAKKIKCGVIGCGILGRFHAEMYKTNQDSDLVAVCDLDPKRAEEFGKLFGVNFYTDYNKMLEAEDIDTVSIATPDFAHRDPIIACARKKMNILCEKPLATDESDLDDIVEVVTKEKIRIMVNFSNRWNVPFYMTREKILSGEMGKPINMYFRLNDTIFVPEQYISWAAKSSILWFLGSHSVDLIIWILNDKVKNVYCVTHDGLLKSKGIDTKDVFLSTLTFANGAVVQLENGWVTPNSYPVVGGAKFDLVCSKAMVSINERDHNYFQLFTEEKAQNPDFFVRPKVYGTYFGYATQSIKGFIRSMTHDEDFKASFEDSVYVHKVLLRIEESAKKGQPVEIDF